MEEKNNDKEYEDALNYLGLDYKEVEDKAFVQHKISTNIQEKITQINKFALDFRMLLEGKEYSEEKGGYKQGTQALCSASTISKLTGIIQNYSQNANLISSKDEEKFVIQLYDAWTKQQNVLLRDRATPERNHRVISKIFKDCLVNMGDIITNSSKNMERIFSGFAKAENIDEMEMLKRGF